MKSYDDIKEKPTIIERLDDLNNINTCLDCMKYMVCDSTSFDICRGFVLYKGKLKKTGRKPKVHA